ncbi:MAG: C1 family peptidase [Planctomycetes bacterium]|nr:C1 family peptidase [Planctomycetota bacterium]
MINGGVLRDDLIAKYQKAFHSQPANRVALNAVTRTAIPDIAMNREVVAKTDFTFSHDIKTGLITNQEKSGRCWMFAGLNTLRLAAIRKMNLDTFELSQSYSFFWDKLERANYFLETAIETRNEDIYSRIMMWLLSGPMSDGGQWDMFANLIRRYGVVPKSVMPETFNSSNSQYLNHFLTLKLREDAMLLREMHKKGKGITELRRKKEDMMADIYKLLAIYMGEPPREFNWQYRDKKHRFRRDSGTLTPQSFFKKYVDYPLDEMVSLINCPTKDKPYQRMYTLQYLGNVVGGEIVRYLNIDIKILKEIAVKVLKDNQPVWFGCDVGKMLHRDGGIMDKRMYEYDKLLGTSFNLDKAGRVDYGESRMTHAMVFTGVNLVNNKPTKWKVENSWGDKGGDKGFYVMSDEWFDEYMYQVVVPKKYLPPRLNAILKQKPIVLKPWDPMGSLAIMH